MAAWCSRKKKILWNQTFFYSIYTECLFMLIILIRSWAPAAHTCNPRYSGGRDQEDHGSKPARANSSVRLYLEKTLHKKGLVEWL
jgi:hypothetical protein